jgi:hypothetical protein
MKRNIIAKNIIENLTKLGKDKSKSNLEVASQ